MLRPNLPMLRTLTAGSLLVCSVATASQDPFYKGKDFYGDQQQGYFWYQVEPPPPEPVPPPSPSPAAQPQAPAKPEETTSDPAKDLSPEDQVRSAMHNLMYEPTIEKAEAFLRYQNWVFDRAETVAQLFQQVILLHPELNPVVERGLPVSQKGNNIATELLQKGQDEAAGEVKDHMGLLFFFRSNCPYCKSEYPIVQRLQRQGFFIQPISLDNAPLPNMNPEDFVPDAGGMAEYFDVSRVPTVVVIDPKQNVSAVIAVGYTTEDVILSRLHAFYDERYGSESSQVKTPRPNKILRPPTKEATEENRRFLTVPKTKP